MNLDMVSNREEGKFSHTEKVLSIKKPTQF